MRQRPDTELTWQVGEGDPRRRAPRPNYEWIFLKDKKTAQAWWKERQGRSLREIQLEAIEWMLAEEEKRPDDFSQEERTSLKSLVEKLQTEALPGNASAIYRIGEDW